MDYGDGEVKFWDGLGSKIDLDADNRHILDLARRSECDPRLAAQVFECGVDSVDDPAMVRVLEELGWL